MGTQVRILKALTFVGHGHNLVLSVSMLENALRAKHLLVTLTEELYFFVLVRVAILNAASLFGCPGCSRGGIRGHLGYGECRQYCVVYREVVRAGVMGDLVERTLYD